ncbi:hypothetical protein NQ117_14680 [Paenibacillus sp. SC116]|uniref:hypothetical protein n=1 Tax=Paenibacillus sp. SC116 TaxID=2968986 RepID=UPI00215AAB50|nr:hypothetical protein [Paenibacillus sp. SC116]MCR8844925.1 hypothetical protein [Paenibacillus sp. SC116]
MTVIVDTFIPKVLLIDGNPVHILDIEDFNTGLKRYLDEHFVSICEGASGNDVKSVKKRVFRFLNSKDDTTRSGAIAEFFLHLYLKKQGYKQECTFLNLEEGSIKKGFDGYYSKDKEEWIMESKSGNIESVNMSHPNKVSEAYRDLSDKFNGDVSNNPWQNAYNHASNIDVSTDANIRQNIKKLSNDFNDENYPSISDFNIIPSSTIFFNGGEISTDISELEKKMKRAVSRYKFKKILILCVNKKSMGLFIDYLNS